MRNEFNMRPFDIQNNGYAGVDFCDADITAESLHHACCELEKDGCQSILVTMISDTVENMVGKLKHLVALRGADDVAERVIRGFHLEGPFLSTEAGYRGAHPQEVMISADVDITKRMIDTCDGLLRLVTLAPECDPDFATTRYLDEQGIVVSAGHCNPSLDQLKGAIGAGLKMVTHFGNACPVNLSRHDNVLQRYLHFREHLWFCFIPDGAHINFYALRNYIDLVGVERSIIVTDAIAAAKMPPGKYTLSGFEVEVDSAGVARRLGSENLAGSTITMPKVIINLREQLHFSDTDIKQLIDTNPRIALGDDTF